MPDEPQNDQTDELQQKVEEAEGEDTNPRKNDQGQQQQEEQQKSDSDKQIEELKGQLARCMADMQNFKRRAEEDKMRFVKFANAELLKEILPIIDNFDRGCQQIPEHLKDDAWTKGVVHTHDDLMKALEKIGVKRMVTVGQILDPTKHEAVLSGFGKKDEIIEELEPGYVYNEETLKPAKVKVGDGNKK